jgi:hypothetical protein
MSQLGFLFVACNQRKLHLSLDGELASGEVGGLLLALHGELGGLLGGKLSPESAGLLAADVKGLVDLNFQSTDTTSVLNYATDIITHAHHPPSK